MDMCEGARKNTHTTQASRATAEGVWGGGGVLGCGRGILSCILWCVNLRLCMVREWMYVLQKLRGCYERRWQVRVGCALGVGMGILHVCAGRTNGHVSCMCAL